MTESITFSGLGSGIDLAGIVDALIEVERQRYIEPFENWKVDWENKISAFQELNTKLVSLQSTVKDLDSISEFLVKNAISTDEDVLSATAGSTAVNGSYSVTVGSGIQHRLASAGKADRDTSSFAGTGDVIQIQVGSSSETITIDDATSSFTLDDIAQEINNEAGLVTAEVLDDGSGSNRYRLVLTGVAGGKDETVTVSVTSDPDSSWDVDFSMTDLADRIDSAEGTLSGTSAVSSGGSYYGTVNKTFTFSIAGADGTSYAVGSDDFTVTWTDTEGNSGSMLIESTDAQEVFQGVSIGFSAGTVTAGDSFAIDVWHPDLQRNQDEGLAKSEKEVHSGFSDEDTTAVTSAAGGDKTFSYRYNGQDRTIGVSGGTTLSELVDLINNDSMNPGVTASILNDGSGLPTSFHLVLTGSETGAAYKIDDIEHDFDNFSGSGAAGGGFQETQSAQNAMIQIDGYPPGDVYLQRATNTVGDAVSGVSMMLNGTGSATISVTTDTAAIEEKISDFVDAFNDMRNYIQEQTAFDENTGEAGILLGNYAVDTVKNRLNNIVTGSAPGFRSSIDTYVALAQIGIRTDIDEGSASQGDLIIDYSELESALSDDPQAVAELFSDYYTGRSAHPDLAYRSSISAITEAGTYEIRFNASTQTGEIRLKGTGEWHTASWDAAEETLTGAEGNPEAGLVVHIADTSSSFTGEVDLRLGMAGVLKEELDNLTNPYDGPMAVLEDNYQDIIDNIDEKIEREENRIELMEQRLVERYARLESTLSELNSQSSYLSLRLEQLT